VLGNPLIHEHIVAPLVVVNLLLSAAGGALAVSLYSWFVTGKPDAMAIGRGTAAGLVAGSAACAFVPAWAAMLVGAVAGILFLLGLYVVDRVRLDDPSASLATFVVPGVWGLLALAILADGHWGAGWNGIGAQEYMGIAGQGVSGLLLATGFQPAGSGQLYAQLTGIGALLVIGLAVPWLSFKFVRWLAWSAQRAAAKQPPPPSAESMGLPGPPQPKKGARGRSRRTSHPVVAEPLTASDSESAPPAEETDPSYNLPEA